ncbi:MAG: HAD-IIA family hydrolase [Bacillota bacterium]
MVVLPAWIVDLDGVVYRGSEVLPGAVEFFERAQSRGDPVVVVSNNSAPTVEEYVARLGRMGIRIGPRQVVSSALAAAQFLARRRLRGPVMAIGEAGLLQALGEAGLEVVAPDGAPASPKVEAVVVGIDRRFTYDRLTAACQAIRAGALFVGTNPDVTVPAEGGRLRPGCGSLLAAVSTCSGVQPVVVGKPHPPIMELAMERLGVGAAGARHEVIVVGDRLDTDIRAAKALGLKGALVLTGVTSRTDAGGGVRPDWIFDDLQHLTDALMGG